MDTAAAPPQSTLSRSTERLLARARLCLLRRASSPLLGLDSCLGLARYCSGMLSRSGLDLAAVFLLRDLRSSSESDDESESELLCFFFCLRLLLDFFLSSSDESLLSSEEVSRFFFLLGFFFFFTFFFFTFSSSEEFESEEDLVFLTLFC